MLEKLYKHLLLSQKFTLLLLLLLFRGNFIFKIPFFAFGSIKKEFNDHIKRNLGKEVILSMALHKKNG